MFCGYFREGVIFFTGRFALFGVELAPGWQAVMVALFFFGSHARIVFGGCQQMTLLFRGQRVPLLRQRSKRLLLCG